MKEMTKKLTENTADSVMQSSAQQPFCVSGAALDMIERIASLGEEEFEKLLEELCEQ